MRARLGLAIAIAASIGAGCSVPDYQLGFDDAGEGDDASSDDADAASVDSAPRDSARADTTTAETGTDSGVDSGGADTSDAGDAADGSVSEVDATDAGSCGTGPACPTGKTCCGGACVDTTTSLANCGGCGNTCAIGGGTPKCEGSACKVASCDTGRGDCDGRADNGCEATLDTTTNCGACGTKCEMPNGIGTCGTGTCQIAGCFSGFDDCDKVVANGCEIDLTTDPLHCGSCAKACPTSGGTPVCVARVCKYSACAAGFGDCDGSGRCLTPIHDDVANCGACGTTCTTAHGTPKCTATTCGIASCASGFANCDASVATGCERSMSIDQNTCATATVLTASGGATPLCDNGAGQATTTVSTFGRQFYKVSLKRCSACKPSDPSRAKFVVKSPAGMAFDLRVYSDAACGTLLGSSTSGALGGTETVTWSDATCPTPKDFLIEVKWRSGDGCGLATLDVTGGYLPFP